MPFGALLVMAWMLILALSANAPAEKVNSALPSAEAMDPPLFPIVLLIISPTGAPTAVDMGSSGMAGTILSMIFLHPGKTWIHITTRTMALIFFINNFLKN